jgi:predicted DNA-binding protein (UPF0251 family)
MIHNTPKDRLDRATRMANDLLEELAQLREEYKALREQAPELLGAREAAELMQIHRKDFARRRAQGRIPAPIASLASGPVWLKAQFTWPNTLKES